MRSLNAAKVRRLLDVLERIYAARDLDAFTTSVPRVLQRLVPADTTALSEVNPRRGRATWVVDPPDAPIVPHREAFGPSVSPSAYQVARLVLTETGEA